MAYASPAPPLIVRGQLTLRTIRGRNGPFNVSRLVTPNGEFVIKDRELEQYPEGKYEGEFILRYIFPKVYPVAGGMRFEIRANLDGMTLFGVEKLKKEEARQFHSQDVDPLDEELPLTAVSGSTDNSSISDPEPPTFSAVATVALSSPTSSEPAPSADPLIDTTPFGAQTSQQVGKLSRGC